MAGDGTRRGDGTLTVGSGQSSLGLSNFSDAGVTAFSAGSQTTITDVVDFFAAGHTLRLNGTTTWSDGTIQIQDAGTVENAGLLQVTGNVAVAVFAGGRKLLRTLLGGVTEVSGTLVVGSELENDGTLRAVPGGTLDQYNGVASPAESTGVFEAAGHRRAVAEQRADGRGLQRHRHRHDPLRRRNESRGARGGLRGRDHRRQRWRRRFRR